MTASFYTNTGNPKKINKTPVLLYSTSIAPFQPLDKQNPRLILAYDSRLENCNYCQIDGVYYFVDTPIKNIGGRVELVLTVDVLKTNAAGIMALNVIVDRSTTKYNSYIYDNQQKEAVNYTTFSIPLGSVDFSGSNGVILACIGGT